MGARVIQLHGTEPDELLRQLLQAMRLWGVGDGQLWRLALTARPAQDEPRPDAPKPWSNLQPLTAPQVVDVLDWLQVPDTAGRPYARLALAELQVRTGNDVISEAIATRRARQRAGGGRA